MRIAERRIPAMAPKAGHDAYLATLRRTGAVTVKTSRGQMVERKRDGSVTVIKDLPVGKRVKRGTVLRRVDRAG
jgi:protein PhnA